LYRTPPERIKRHDDARLYQPSIHSRRIRELHRISKETGQPITVLVDRALQEFIERPTPENSQNHSEADGEEQDDSFETDGRYYEM